MLLKKPSWYLLIFGAFFALIIGCFIAAWCLPAPKFTLFDNVLPDSKFFNGFSEWVWIILVVVIISFFLWKFLPRSRVSLPSIDFGNFGYIFVRILGLLIVIATIYYGGAWWKHREQTKNNGASFVIPGNTSKCCTVSQPPKPSYTLLTDGNNDVKAGQTYRYHRLCATKYYFNPTEGEVVLRFTYENDPSRWYEGKAQVSTAAITQGTDPLLDGDYLVVADRDATIVIQSAH